MPGRQVQAVPPTDERIPLLSDFAIRERPQWMWVGVAAVLSFLHFSVCIPAFLHSHWEGYMSLIFAIVFANVALGLWKLRSDVAVISSKRIIRIRHRIGRFGFDRAIPFDSVHGVRLLLPSAASHSDSKLEILCENEDIECPVTDAPRQQALYLAMAMGVQLIKVYGDGEEEDLPQRR